MLVMGIESSAHTFGVGIVRNGKIIANEKMMYDVGTHGMIPVKVAEFHAQNANSVIKKALLTAGLKLSDLEGIGYTRGPGLGPCLQIGAIAAKTISKFADIPITGVNHGLAHIEITRNQFKFKEPIALYVSGGNSQILKLEAGSHRHYRVLGETFDIGVGNMLDSFARNLGLNPAWGSTVAKVAAKGKYVSLPYTVKGMDFSFTGLLTSATKLIPKVSKEDLCYSIQETAFAMLTEALERALLLTNTKELCISGGVAQSKRLREMLSLMAKEHKIKFGFAKDEFNADNGAMIAFVAERMLKAGMSTPVEECHTEQRYRVDAAEVP